MLGKVATRCELVVHRRALQRVPTLAAQHVIPAVTTTPIRTLSNATRSVRTDGFYVSKKAVKVTLGLGAALTGGYWYLSVFKEREDADRKEIRVLLEQSQWSLENGDIEQSMRELEKAYDLHKTKFPQDKGVIAMAMAIGASYEKKDQFAEAMPYYHEALGFIPLESRIVYREDLRVLVLDRLGQCSKQTGDLEAAGMHFKQAIEAYDQLKGKLSLSPESDKELSILSKLDEDILNVLLHYAVLLTTLRRPDDAARARQRLTTIARGSPQLRSQVMTINRQVDDYIALEKIREERKFIKTKGDQDSNSA